MTVPNWGLDKVFCLLLLKAFKSTGLIQGSNEKIHIWKIFKRTGDFYWKVMDDRIERLVENFSDNIIDAPLIYKIENMVLKYFEDITISTIP